MDIDKNRIAAVYNLVSALQTQLQTANLQNQKYEAIIVSYQRKLSKLIRKRNRSPTNQLAPPKKPQNDNEKTSTPTHSPSKQTPATDRLARLTADLHLARSKNKQLSDENLSLSRQLKSRDDALASDTAELSRLRQDNLKMRDLEMRINVLEAENASLKLRDQTLQNENNLRLNLGEESTRVLQKEVKRLNEELATARCEADAAAASSSSALRTANELQINLTQQLTDAKTTNTHMEQYIANIEKQLSAVRTEAEQQKLTFEEEADRLKQIADIQKEMTIQAEQRLKDFEAIVETLQQEVQEKDRQPKTVRSVQSHTEVLLKSMEQALDAKQAQLRQISLDQQKLKSSHSKMLQNEQQLKRIADEARQEARQAQREVVRLKAIIQEMSKQKGRPVDTAEEATEAKRLSFETGSIPLRNSGSLRFSGFDRNSGYGRESGMGRVSTFGRTSDFNDPEIGPRSTIPLHPPRQDEVPMDVDSQLQELFNIRMRHQKILRAMQETKNMRMSTE
ncbi:hypothetical protein BWQ96_04370 [Gracilariopsis chorda]|uniref:Uncharacterized protein n=1 Tax=Gracilariopsis chorda TaxID=448386 RepID=A0A2V3IUN8_9FLOR|nr:hypothetical protein BWQ96_04370 [Gracilariopsis chorda]|eukprot:PXF45833.1 hypothetical protein BWQ96_04370 [Gracilariopsis chorda]